MIITPGYVDKGYLLIEGRRVDGALLQAVDYRSVEPFTFENSQVKSGSSTREFGLDPIRTSRAFAACNLLSLSLARSSLLSRRIGSKFAKTKSRGSRVGNKLPTSFRHGAAKLFQLVSFPGALREFQAVGRSDSVRPFGEGRI